MPINATMHRRMPGHATTLLVLVTVAVACAGCGDGDGPKTLLRLHETVVALALRGSELAWLSGHGPSGCHLSLSLESSGKMQRVRLPPAVSHPGVFDCLEFAEYDSAKLVVSGGDIGWSVEDEGGNAGAIAQGASSVHPSRATVLGRELTDGPGNYPNSGHILGGVAATDDAVYWGRASLDARGACEFSYADPGCQTRVASGAVYTWSRGRSRRVPDLPVPAALAAAGDLVAIAPRIPGWSGGRPPIGPIEVRGPGGLMRIRVKPGNNVLDIRLSHHLLAVLDDRDELFVYDLPSGRFLRRLSSEGRFEVTDTKLVLWNGRRLLVVDPRTGRRRTVVAFVRPASETAFHWTVTAVAVDGDRVAWAQTTNLGVSIVRAVRVK